jgi:hypothetical protein
VGVVVLLPEIGLVHVRVRVFSSVGVGVVVVVLEMFVLVAGVRMGVFNSVGVGVVVGVRFVVTVSMVCHCRLLCYEIPAVSIVLSAVSPRKSRRGGFDGILSGLQPSRRLRCRTVRMGLRCQGSAVISRA